MDSKGSPTESRVLRRHYPRDDREILLEQLSQSCWLLDAVAEAEHKDAFRNATDQLKGDREVVL